MPLLRGHTLKGRVFDQSSGTGIGDAWVAVRDPSEPWPTPNPRQRHETSKPDGTFVLDGVPSGDITVLAGAKDHASREIAVIVNDDTPPLEVGLTTGGKIAGMVVGPDGTPAKRDADAGRSGYTFRHAARRNGQLQLREQASRALPADREHSSRQCQAGLRAGRE